MLDVAPSIGAFLPPVVATYHWYLKGSVASARPVPVSIKSNALIEYKDEDLYIW